MLAFDFSIQYVPGKLNLLPDCLSRLYPDLCTTEKQNINFINSLSRKDEINKEERIAMSLGKNIPSIEQQISLLEEVHSISHCGYQGLFKLLWKNDWYWKNMKTDCKNYCLSCANCQRNTIVKSGYDPQVSVSACLPMDHIAIDTIGPFPISSNNQKYVLIAVDIFTRFIFLKSMPDKSANSVAVSL